MLAFVFLLALGAVSAQNQCIQLFSGNRGKDMILAKSQDIELSGGRHFDVQLTPPCDNTVLQVDVCDDVKPEGQIISVSEVTITRLSTRTAAITLHAKYYCPSSNPKNTYADLPEPKVTIKDD